MRLRRWLASLFGLTGWVVLAYVVAYTALVGDPYRGVFVMPWGVWELIGDLLTVVAGLGFTSWLVIEEGKMIVHNRKHKPKK